MKCKICGSNIDKESYIYTIHSGKKRFDIELCPFCNYDLLGQMFSQMCLEHHLNDFYGKPICKKCEEYECETKEKGGDKE